MLQASFFLFGVLGSGWVMQGGATKLRLLASILCMPSVLTYLHLYSCRARPQHFQIQ